jgi:general secretion pathway protein D
MKNDQFNSRAVSWRLASLSLGALLLPILALAQTRRPDSVALPERVAPSPTTPEPARMLPLAPNVPPAVSPILDSPAPLPEPTTPALTPPPATTAADAVAAPVPVRDAATVTVVRPGGAAKADIMLNFQGASLSDVLNYLSEAAGFVIVQEAPVSGTVNVVSRQPLNPEEAVDLLNAVLVEKGYVALRNGRILKIVNRRDAQKRDLPVETGSDPEMIPRKDQMVTQILPVRYGEAAKLVENLRPLLADSATISANEGSNSLLLTDTQTNIRRIAEIIRAIDTSVMGISTIKVFPLQFANAKELATVITQLFATNTQTDQGRRRGGGFGGFGGFGGGGRGGGGDGNQPSGPSEARQAASRVVAVADDQSNSLIVCATQQTIEEVSEIVAKIDTSISDITDTRIFRLENADAVELAETVNSLYADTTNQTGQNRDRGRRGFGGDGRGGQGGAQLQSQRALIQSKVVAVGDPRTNALLVTAARETMAEIAEMVGRLDSSDARRMRVYVHSLEHADPDSVAMVLRGMLGDETANNSASQIGAGRLNERSASGAVMDTSAFSNGGRGGGGGGR